MRAIFRWLDLRDGEGRVVAGAFAVLFSIIAAHSMLEAARDALFLAKLSVRSLSLVYVGIAAGALAAGSATTSLVARLGPQRALAASMFTFATLVLLLHAVRGHTSAVLALYVTSGLLGSAVVPQFWAILANAFSVTRARRLFGLIASAAGFGSVVGSAAAALMLRVLPVSSLLPAAAVILTLTGASIALAPPGSRRHEAHSTRDALAAVREEPLLFRIALLIVLATSTAMVVDYLFKLQVARSIAPAQLGSFFARFYTVQNALSVALHLLLAGALVRRTTVSTAAALTPLAIVALGGVSLFSGGALLAVIAMKATDAGLRFSVHRVSTELLYVPVPSAARARAKPLLDGAVARAAQGVTALGLYALTAVTGSRRVIALAGVVLAVSWVAVAVSIRKPYLALFRRALSREGGPAESGELDLESAELLVERLASARAEEVIAAMDILARRKREGLLSALILHHESEAVLRRALEIFSTTRRSDWIPLASGLVSHRSESVRTAAMRALAVHGATEVLVAMTADASPRARAYAVTCVAAQTEREDLLRDPRVSALLDEHESEGALAAVADLGAPASAMPLLRRLAAEAGDSSSTERVTLLAAAMGRSRSAEFVPFLVHRLGQSQGRDAVRAALCAIGEPAFELLRAALRETTLPRRLRVHLPRTISRFGHQRAANVLVECLTSDPDGLVRYKALRGLGRLVSDHPEIAVDRANILSLAHSNLVEHLRLLAHRLHVPRDADEATHVLLGLLDDKLSQSLERVFRLLKIAFPREDIHRVHQAALSQDDRMRANAAELLDVLLSGENHEAFRRALRVVMDALPVEERVARCAWVLPQTPPATTRLAIASLIADRDAALSTLAREYAARHRDVVGTPRTGLRVIVGGAS